MKEEVKGDAELAAAFEGETAVQVMSALDGPERGRRFVEERVSRTRRPSATRRSGRTSSPSRPGARTRRR